MKLKTLVSTSLAIGFLFNTTLSSYASILSEDGRYEMFERTNNVTINNIIDESLDYNLEIEGNTLVSPLNNTYYGGSASNPVSSLNDGIIKEVSPNGNYFMCNSNTNSYLTLKNNTTYTMSIYGTIDFDTVNSVKIVPFYRIDNNDDVYETIQTKSYYVKNLEYFEIKHVFSTNDEVMHSFGFYTTPYENIKNINISYGIVEGDYSQLKIPFLEKSQSLGENGEFRVVSSSKNLIDTSKASQVGHYAPAKMDGDRIVLESNGVDRISLGFPVYLEKGECYRFYYQNIEGDWNVLGQTLQIHASASSHNSQVGFSVNRPFVWELSSGVYFLRIYNSLESGVVSANLQLEKGENTTLYEKYISNNHAIDLIEPLRSVNDVKDRLIIKNGHVYKEKNIGHAILDGTEDWWITTNENGVRFFETIDALHGKHYHKSGTTEIKSDILTLGDIRLNSSKINNYSIASGMLDTNLWRISTTQTMSLDEFKEWLSINKPSIYYELEEPIYEKIDLNLSLNFYKAITNLNISSNIPTNMRITVDRVLNRATEAVELAKSSPTVENLARARMWSNLIKESVKKDELQGEINDITDIEDLELERKSVTANMDLYVKSENALSMSLDTNYVTFEGYSGVSDMEKLGAVNISINSSLPYTLNAYMPVELSNSDGSSKMPTNLLNIRENGIGDYKRFVNTSDKVILNDSCEAGNDIIHKIDLKLSSTDAHKSDVYKAVVKFEAVQK